MMKLNLNSFSDDKDIYVLTPTEFGIEKGKEVLEVEGLVAAKLAMNINRDCYTMEKK